MSFYSRIRQGVAAAGFEGFFPPAGSGKFVGAEQAEVAEDECDAIVRYDVDDEVDAEHYPDGVYWRFIHADLAGKRFVVKNHKVAEVTDVYEATDGQFWWLTRKRK